MFKKGRKKDTVRFVYTPQNGAKTVMLAGDFNEWEPKRMTKQKNGSFALTVPLEPGTYQYKYKVDDDWYLDPDIQNNTVNEFGTLNSLAEVD